MIKALAQDPTPRRKLLEYQLIHAMRDRRTQSEISVNVLARAMGYTPAALRSWEDARTTPSLAAWIAWCDALRWHPSEAIAAAEDRDRRGGGTV